MSFETDTHGRVNIFRNSAVARASAGLGSLHSKNSIREDNAQDRMWNFDKTEFNDTICIIGRPKWWIPIGIATFLCDVEGDFSQPLAGDRTVGDGEAFASFFAKEITEQEDEQAWSFPTMKGPSLLTPVSRVLTVSIVFLIGAPIYMQSTLNSSSRERSSNAKSDDLDAKIEIKTTLRPIKVEGVDNPIAITLTDSGTKYYTESEPGAKDVPLRRVMLQLRHH